MGVVAHHIVKRNRGKRTEAAAKRSRQSAHKKLHAKRKEKCAAMPNVLQPLWAVGGSVGLDRGWWWWLWSVVMPPACVQK